MNHHEVEFSQQIPVIECGIANIKLGVYSLLSRKYKEEYDPGFGISLAYCVVREVFFDPVGQPTLEEFATNNDRLIAAKMALVFSDPSLQEAISICYSIRTIQLGWITRSPLNEETLKITKRATDYDFVIPSLSDLGGKDAIVNFLRYSKDYVGQILPR